MIGFTSLNSKSSGASDDSATRKIVFMSRPFGSGCVETSTVDRWGGAPLIALEALIATLFIFVTCGYLAAALRML